jgi:hypothetical protein
MDSIERIKQFNEQKANKQEAETKHKELALGTLQTQEVILRSFRSLIDYLDNRVSKTQVTNQLKEVGTPDALKVKSAIESLHKTLKTHENTDLSEVTKVLQGILDEAKQIPKSHNEIDIPKPIDHTKQFESLTKAIQSVEKVVKAQKLVAEAPIVNLPETQVNVDAPDLKPIESGLKNVVKAVDKVKIPETDLKPLEKLLSKANRILQEIADTTPVSGGGGGGRATPYEDENAVPAFPTLEQGGIPTTGTTLAVRIDDTTTADTTYIGKAPIGTATSSATWQVAKLATSSGLIKTWADGNASYDNIWDNRASLSYS